MNSNALLKNSSLFVAYMGCLGWGSAYFYGWGVSFYYGFPWWVVSAGIDDVARSLFHAITIMVILFLSWGAGVLFFLGIKNKASMHELSFFRLFLASFLLFVPVVIEFSVLKNHLALKLLTLSVAVSLILVFLIRTCGHRVSVSCFSEYLCKNIFLKYVLSALSYISGFFHFLLAFTSRNSRKNMK
ncbi:hypothetical protein BANRA_04097 [Escherichia coli]|nr:hypothetical protein BANRA_04097 [Escherichia coli]